MSVSTSVCDIHISVQTQDIDINAQYEFLTKHNSRDGAVATFLGRVREQDDDETIAALELEHYPGMTESTLKQISEQAQQRWDINRISVIHRVGKIDKGENIVFVGVSSPHRGNAFDACEFIMDFLKTKAPFWKKQHTGDDSSWVAAKDSDTDKAKSWN